MSRVYNFSAGPAVLPEEVLKEAQEEMLDYRGCGMSVMEMSHRSKVFQNIIDEAEADLRDLMGIPSNYKVLFLQGGASLQFSMIPMNLMKNGVADYIVTGQWAKKAYAEAQKYGKANKIASSRIKHFPTSRTAAIFRSARMPIMFISVKTTPFTEPNTKNCRIPRAKPWWQTSPPVSSPNLLMSPITASSTAVSRKTSDLPEWSSPLSVTI